MVFQRRSVRACGEGGGGAATGPVGSAVKTEVGRFLSAINHVLKSNTSTHGCQHMVEMTSWPYPCAMPTDSPESIVDALGEGAGTNSPACRPKGAGSHSLSFDSPIFCDVRRIACVTNRRWRPETTVPAGERLGRPSVGSPHRVRNIGSARQPRSADRRHQRGNGQAKSAGQRPDKPDGLPEPEAQVETCLGATRFRRERERGRDRGPVAGPNLNGTLKGVDYLCVPPPMAALELHILAA